MLSYTISLARIAALELRAKLSSALCCISDPARATPSGSTTSLN
jgi:hypothetical protein